MNVGYIQWVQLSINLYRIGNRSSYLRTLHSSQSLWNSFSLFLFAAMCPLCGVGRAVRPSRDHMYELAYGALEQAAGSRQLGAGAQLGVAWFLFLCGWPFAVCISWKFA